MTISERPLLAESSPSNSTDFHDLSVRFGEKQTLGGRISISVLRMTALPPKADIELVLILRAANDPKRTFLPLKYFPIMLTVRQSDQYVLGLEDNNEKAKPAERWGRKATGPRFLREVTDDSPKDPKVAELPN